MTDMGREFQWDDTIEKDASDFIVLPEGDYNFMVESYERGRHNGSDKLPPCNKAILKIRIEATEGTAVISHNLFLHSKMEGMLSAFFSCIGQKKKGEPLKMNWNMVPGSVGRLKLGIRTYQGNDGKEKQANEIKRFYPKDENQTPKFKPGSF